MSDKRSLTGKQPYAFRPASGAPFALAGIWDRWEKDGEVLETVAIIVTKANNLMGGIHDRMPVIVPAKQYADWLARAPLDGGVFAHKKFPRHQWPMPLIIHINFKELEFILILNIFLDNLNLLSHSTMRYFIGMF